MDLELAFGVETFFSEMEEDDGDVIGRMDTLPVAMVAEAAEAAEVAEAAEAAEAAEQRLVVEMRFS